MITNNYKSLQLQIIKAISELNSTSVRFSSWKIIDAHTKRHLYH